MLSTRQKFGLMAFIICFFAISVLRAQPLMQAVKQTISQRLNEGDILGVSIAYISPDGNINYYSKGYLSTNQKHPANKKTIYEMGSVTKTFTTLILARMVLQHKISLNDPINKFLPDSIHAPSYHGKKITLEELATHTSGLPRMPSNFHPKDPLNPYANYNIRDLYEFLDHYKLTKSPGTSCQYSNLGVGLLGTLLTQAAGKSYAELLHQYITGPLQMNNTELKVPKVKLRRFSDPYFYGRPVQHWDFKALAGAGALRSTAEDLAAYMKAQMGLKKTALDSAIALTHKIRFKVNKNRLVGLVWMISTAKDTIIWHNGETGGFRSFVGFNKENGTGVVVLSSGRDIIDDIGMHLLNPKYPLRKVKQSISVNPEILALYTGTYKFDPNFAITITRDGDQLFEQATDQQKFKIYPESKTKFFLKVVDAQITFITDSSGRFTTLKLYQNGRASKGKR
jgi:CubicO group peptidase (beta-lactamase class C family)